MIKTKEIEEMNKAKEQAKKIYLRHLDLISEILSVRLEFKEEAKKHAKLEIQSNIDLLEELRVGVNLTLPLQQKITNLKEVLLAIDKM